MVAKRNPVAKFMEDFNRPTTMVDRKQQQKRGKRKHKKDLRDETQ
jgi:hypothetical protein